MSGEAHDWPQSGHVCSRGGVSSLGKEGRSLEGGQPAKLAGREAGLRRQEGGCLKDSMHFLGVGGVRQRAGEGARGGGGGWLGGLDRVKI